METTHFTKLKKDPLVEKAKRLLLEAVSNTQKTLNSIQPANPLLQKQSQETIEQLEKQRGGKLWFPYLGSGIGHGPFVELIDGSVKYDFISGIGVHHFGHSHPEILSTTIDAALSDLIMQGHLQQNNDQAELIDFLTKESKMDHCFLSSSGSMANDNALKVAMQKNFPAKRILAFERGFSGRTYAMIQTTEKPTVRDGISVQMGVDFIPFFDESKPEESTKRAIDALKHCLWRYPKDYAMMIFEMIQGEGGYYPGSHDFFKSLMEILKEHHIAIHVDEIQTFGRTSKAFAYQHFSLQQFVDIVTIGKLSQVSATLFTKEYCPKPGLLSQTFTSSTSAICASKTILQLMIKEGFFGIDGKNMKLHQEFVSRFEAINKRHPDLMRGPYGLGAMIAFTPFDGHYEKVVKYTKQLFEAGVISFLCGTSPTRIRFLPPVGVVTPKHLDQVAEILEKVALEA